MITITKTSQLRCILTTVTCLTVNRTKTSFGSKLRYTKLDSSIPKICTKTGDKGEYSSKSLHIIWSFHQRKLCSSSCHNSQIMLTCLTLQIQCVLQDVGSNIATPWSSKSKLSSQPVADLESCLNAFTEELPPLTNFILPVSTHSGGNFSLSQNLHLFKCFISPLFYQVGAPDPPAAKHPHGLSDYLFTVARYTAMKEGNEEKIYKRPE
uniref:Cobalamin adenosyltransferase-like domain-containing protein n=1 Tax=Salmo trutta TaxID=8032 RepID=A0A674A1Z2_SALTR